MIEALPQGSELRELQEKLLKQAIARALAAPMYRRILKGVDPSTVSLENLHKLPYTSKQDLREAYPTGYLAVPLSRVARVHASSGTTGKPVLSYYTRSDLELWYMLLARCLYTIGVRPGDVFQNTVAHGLFTGVGYTYAAERLGCTVVPAGPAGPEKQLALMKDLGVTAFHATPSFALRLAAKAEELGYEPGRDLKLRVAILGAEPWTEHMRERIEKGLGVQAFNNYGFAEAGGPGLAIELPDYKGLLMIWADYFIAEVVDPETGEHVSEGEEGELVITTLRREAMPLIRFRTKDLVVYRGCDGPFKGYPMISWVKGRLDDMVKVRGVGLYPEAIDRVVYGHPLLHDYQVVIEDGDVVRLRLEPRRRLSEEEKQRLAEEVAAKVKEETMLRMKVEILEPGALASQGKVKRIIDARSYR